MLVLLLFIGAVSGDDQSEVTSESRAPEASSVDGTEAVGPEATEALEPTTRPDELTQEPPPQSDESTSTESANGAGSLSGDIARLTVAAEDRTGYDRDLFGDYDRPAVLAANFAAWPACDGYYSLADDQCYTQASEVDVDHIVALGEAWDSGASAWSDPQRDEFAGDFDNLWLMTDNLNQSKSAQDLAEWTPLYQEAVCFYVQAYVTVKLEWNLSVDAAEKGALESLAADCDGAEPPSVPTAPPSPPTAAPVVEPTTPPSQYLPGDAYNCGDFDTYAEAKAYFDAVPGDPSRLDGNGDGIPCESLPGGRERAGSH